MQFRRGVQGGRGQLGRRFDQLKERVGGSAGTSLAPWCDVSTRTDRAAKGESPYHGRCRVHDCAEVRYTRPAHREFISVQGRRARRSNEGHLLGVEPNCHKEIPIGASAPKLQRRSF